jgi:hypothetical protein
MLNKIEEVCCIVNEITQNKIKKSKGSRKQTLKNKVTPIFIEEHRCNYRTKKQPYGMIFCA